MMGKNIVFFYFTFTFLLVAKLPIFLLTSNEPDIKLTQTFPSKHNLNQKVKQICVSQKSWQFFVFQFI